jgi:protein phosphatase
LTDEAHHLFAVADGMGGHRAGEVASATAIDALKRAYLGGQRLDAAVGAANAAVFAKAAEDAALRGMGTTLTALVVLRADESNVARFALINVGDSRTYLLRNGVLHRATVDHSYVQELVNTGHISEDEARTHPRRNIVTRALGIEPTVRVDTWLVPMVHGDRFILCSDGLVDEVHDDDIEAIAVAAADPQQAADQLVAKANANGGRDNVTVVVVDVLQGVEPTAADSELESEPGWPGSESTNTMIDADAHSVVAGSGTIAADGSAAPPVVSVAAAPTADPPRRRRVARLLKLLGAAAVLTVVITLIAVAVHNGNTDNGDSPATTTVISEPDTVKATTTVAETTGTSTTGTSTTGTSTTGP